MKTSVVIIIIICIIICIIGSILLYKYLSKEDYLNYDKMYDYNYDLQHGNLSLENIADVNDPEHQFSNLRNCGGTTYNSPEYYNLIENAQTGKYQPQAHYHSINLLQNPFIYLPVDPTYRTWEKYRPQNVGLDFPISGIFSPKIDTLQTPYTEHKEQIPPIKAIVFSRDGKLYKTNFGQTDYNRFMNIIIKNLIENYRIQKPEKNSEIYEQLIALLPPEETIEDYSCYNLEDGKTICVNVHNNFFLDQMDGKFIDV